MNYFIIKIIAIITMLIDHLGYIVFDNNIVMRIIGRISFPLFCFLIVNGFIHTRNKWKYFFRLALFALISEPIFNLIIDASLSNVFITLSLGVLLLIIIDSISIRIKNKFIKFPIEIIFVFIFSFIAYFLKSDYNFFGIIMIYILYKTKSNKFYMGLAIILLNLFFGFAIYSNIQCFGAFSGIIIFFFKEEKVYVNKYLKYFFYIFYPLHLFILYFFGGA